MKRKQLTRMQFLALVDPLRDGPQAFTDYAAGAAIYSSKCAFEVTPRNLRAAASDAGIILEIINAPTGRAAKGAIAKMRERLADAEHRITHLEKQLGVKPPAPAFADAARG